MHRTDLLEIIQNGENSGVEFKRDDIRPEQLAKEVVALPNLRGGLIFFTAKVHPLMLPFYEEIELEDGKRADVAPDACLW